jgi:hypothetical protein
MSDKVFALVVILSLFVSALLWVPFLHLCRRCHRRVFKRTLPLLGMGLLTLTLHGVAFGQLTALNSITTLAGSGTQGFSGDGGQATAAAMNGPYGVVVDKSGNLYFSEGNGNRVRKVAANGVITTIAGNGTGGWPTYDF